MTKKLLTLLAALCVASTLQLQADPKSSEEMENTTVVPAGTYEVTALRVDPEEEEIYVKTEDDKVLELYFTDKTVLMQDGKKVTFKALKKGQTLKVKVEKDGNHNKPLEVTMHPAKSDS